MYKKPIKLNFAPTGEIHSGCNVEVCPPAIHARGFQRECNWLQCCRDSTDFLARAEESFHSLSFFSLTKYTEQVRFRNSLLSSRETGSCSCRLGTKKSVELLIGE